MKSTRGVLNGKVAIITGAGRGIGKATAYRMARAGANVVVADIDIENAIDTAEKLTDRLRASIAVKVDVADGKSVKSMVHKALNSYGRVDILVNNAGIMFRTRFQNISIKEWENLIKVNLTGPFLCTQAVVPVMKENKFGRIVNISSSAGRSVSTLGGVHYTATKAGLLGFTRAVAKEVASFGITINSVCPGLIDTKMARDTTTKDEMKTFMNSFPIKRLGTPEEIGDLVIFLCSDKSSYITGASIDINGGALMI